jgi:hypothetical protein
MYLGLTNYLLYNTRQHHHNKKKTLETSRLQVDAAALSAKTTIPERPHSNEEPHARILM